MYRGHASRDLSFTIYRCSYYRYIFMILYLYIDSGLASENLCSKVNKAVSYHVTMYFHRTLYLCMKLYLFLLILCKMQLFKVSTLTIFSYYYYFDYFSDTLRGSEIQTGFWMIASDTCRRKLLISFKYKFIVLYLTFNFFYACRKKKEPKICLICLMKKKMEEKNYETQNGNLILVNCEGWKTEEYFVKTVREGYHYAVVTWQYIRYMYCHKLSFHVLHICIQSAST